MAETPSLMLPLGTKAPDFKLLDAKTHQLISLQDIKSSIATVVMFICNHCPYVIHIRAKLFQIAEKYQGEGVSFVAINSNDAKKYPADGFDKMQEEVIKHKFPFPYLFDETQEVAKKYQAACTPDFFIFDNQLQCIYRGRFDNATPGNKQPVTGADLSRALDQILAGKPLNFEQKPSLGCNIKWT